MHACHGKSGASSFRMHDPETVFSALELKAGDRFLDLGCGPGDYSVEAAGIIGDTGAVYAVDISSRMTGLLNGRAHSLGLHNLEAMTADITKTLPLETGCVDVCLMATVLHIPAVACHAEVVFAEMRRILKPGGDFVIIDCKKEDSPFGPPLNMRWSPEDVETLAERHAFRKSGLIELGENYMLSFSVIGG